MGKAKPLKIFGLQRSGTNLAKLLLTRNFDVTPLVKGYEWKHGFISDEHQSWTHDGMPVRLMICIKNPYAWLVSCYKYFRRNRHCDRSVCRQFRRSWSFAEFARNPTYTFQNPVDRWNSLNRHWLEFPDRKEVCEVITHESMLRTEGQKQVLQRIEKNQGFARKLEKLSPARRQVSVGMRRHGPFNIAYYEEKHYLAAFDQALLSFVNQAVDPGLLARLGYSKAAEEDVLKAKALVPADAAVPEK